MINRIYIYIIFYFVLLYTAALFSWDVSNYNYIVEILFGSLAFVLFPLKKSIFISFNIFILFIFIFIFTYKTSNIYYLITDFLLTIFIIFFLEKIKTLNIHFLEPALKLFYRFSIIYIVLLLITLFIPGYIVDGRFNGLGFSCNITSSIALSLCIYVYIYNEKITNLIFVLFTLLLLLFFAKTRALLFGFPLILYYLNKTIGIKKTLFILIPICLCIIIYFIPILEKELRLNTEDSFNTRAAIYIQMIEVLKDSYFVIPHGFNADQIYIDNFLGTKGFPVHNDFLKYIYNYGFLFVLFLIYIVNSFTPVIRNKNERFLIVLAFSSNALQNALFSIYVLIPFFFILFLFKRKASKCYSC